MKVLILGIDGLEYDFVEKYNLQNLKQREYGKVIIPKSCYFDKGPWTPLIWSSFLTGKEPVETGVNPITFRRWNSSFIQKLREFSVKIGLNKIKGKRKILRLFGFKQRYWDKNDYSALTIFDYAKKHVTVNVPMFSSDWKLDYHRKNAKNSKDMLRGSLDEFLEIREKTLKEIGGDWDLFMSYTKILDVYGHLAYGTKLFWERYVMIDNFAKQVAQRLKDKTVLLIISDHGIKKGSLIGEHSDHAFYSLNMNLDLRNISITDFYKIIKTLLEK